MKKTIALMLVLALLLSGCGGASKPTEAPTTEPTTIPTEPPMDAKTLTSEMMAASEGKTATKMTTEMVMDAQIVMEAMDMSYGMAMDVAMDMMVQEDPTRMYMEMDMDIKVMGEETAQNMQIYGSVEDGAVVTYAYDAVNDQWAKSESDELLSSMDSMEIDLTYLQAIPEEGMTLEENTRQMDGREVYVLHYVLTGDQMDDAGMGDILGAAGMNGVDFTGFEVPYTVYVDSETFLMVASEVELGAADALMNSAVASILGAGGDAVDMQIDLQEFRVAIRNISYEPVEVPQVPEEGILKANRGTPYPIEEADVKLNIYAPVGFTYYEGDYYAAGFINAEETQAVYATLYTDEEFQEFYGAGDLAGFGFTEACVEYGNGPEIEGWTTLWGILEDGMRIQYAWIQIGGCKLLLDSADYLEQPDTEAIFNQLIAMVDIPETPSV